MKIKVLLTSAMTIALCLCVIAGSTFALFTKEEVIKMQITAGSLNVTSYIDGDSVEVKSSGYTEFADTNVFANGGVVTVYENMAGQNFNVTVQNMTPGDAFRFNIVVQNKANFAIESEVVAKSVFGQLSDLPQGAKDLFEALEVDVQLASGDGIAAGNSEIAVAKTGTSVFTVTVAMAEDSVEVDGETIDINDYQGAISQIAFTVTSVQTVEPDPAG